MSKQIDKVLIPLIQYQQLHLPSSSAYATGRINSDFRIEQLIQFTRFTIACTKSDYPGIAITDQHLFLGKIRYVEWFRPFINLFDEPLNPNIEVFKDFALSVELKVFFKALSLMKFPPSLMGLVEQSYKLQHESIWKEKVECINEFISQIRNLLRNWENRSLIRARNKRIGKNLKSCREFTRVLFEQHGELTVFQVDLAFTPYVEDLENNDLASRPSIEMLKNLTDKDGVKHAHPTKFAATLSETIGFAQQMPQFNGQIQVCLSPLVQAFKNLGLTSFDVNQPFNPHFFINVLAQFQVIVQTRAFAERVESWTALSEHTAKAYDNLIKTLLKNANGFDLYELIVCAPLNPNLLPNIKVTSQTQYSRSLDKEIIQLICKNEKNNVCAVMCKTEITINQQYVDRYIIAVQCQYIDDKHQMKDSSFVHDIQALTELHSNSKVYFQPCSLNGFMTAHRFMNSTPQLKAQIKQLKTYLVGTDTLVRLHADQSSFRILYTKV